MGIYLIADSTLTLQGVLGTLVTIINVVLGLSFVIFVHELGHFLAAKLCGVKAEKFYVGFDVPPWKLFGIRMPSRIARVQWGETEYGIGIVPLGGYVKMLGQDDNPANAKKEAERIRQAGFQQDTELVAKDAKPGIDPRSYQAQTVPERMFIISAGVIMNIIFAALMAAVAFRMGVNYQTCDIAGALTGSPAWRAEIQAGDRILQVGREGEPQEYVRQDEVREHALFAGLSSDEPEPIDLLVKQRDGKSRWVGLAPRRLSEDAPPLIGVLFARSNEIGAVLPHTAAGKATPPLQVGDRVIAVNGKTLDSSRTNKQGQFIAWEMDHLVTHNPEQPLHLTVERKHKKSGTSEQLDITIPSQSMKWLGFHVRMGPITAIREGSPAEAAGLKIGDIVFGIDGQSVGDPLTLPTRFAEMGIQEFTLNVWHKSGSAGKFERRDVLVTPTTTDFASTTVSGPDLSLEGLGLAYTIRNVVYQVEPNSPADDKLRQGDLIRSVRLVGASEKIRSEMLEEFGKEALEPFKLSSAQNWIAIHQMVQTLRPGIELMLKVQRGSNELEVQLAPHERPGHYVAERGFDRLPFEREFVSQTWSEALGNGVEETKDRLAHVAIVLKLLLTGRVSADNLGGPIRIAAVAGHEANLSITRLLMFLTFLSANLALLNALPVPVLDGGHFLFLTIELIRRRPVPEEWQQRLSFLGLAALLLLMFFVVFNDLRWLM